MERMECQWNIRSIEIQIITARVECNYTCTVILNTNRFRWAGLGVMQRVEYKWNTNGTFE